MFALVLGFFSSGDLYLLWTGVSQRKGPLKTFENRSAFMQRVLARPLLENCRADSMERRLLTIISEGSGRTMALSESLDAERDWSRVENTLKL